MFHNRHVFYRVRLLGGGDMYNFNFDIYILDCILKDLTIYISTGNIREYNFPLS